VYRTAGESLQKAVVQVSVQIYAPPLPAHVLPLVPAPHERVNVLTPLSSVVSLAHPPDAQVMLRTPLPSLLNFIPDPHPLEASSPVPEQAQHSRSAEEAW